MRDMPFDESRKIIATELSHQFGLNVIDVFLVGFGEFMEIARKYPMGTESVSLK